MAKVPPIRHTFLYAAPPERVFSALTSAAQLKKWFAERAEVSAREGGRYHLTWGEYTMQGRVTAAVRPKRLHIDWVDRFPNGKTFETEARFELRAKGKGTVLKLTHRGFRGGKKWIALYGAIESGWAYYLLNLRAFLEQGLDLRSTADELSA